MLCKDLQPREKPRWHVTRLSHHSITLMNKQERLHHFQSEVVRWNFLWLWLLKHWKNCIAHSDVQTFLEGEENQYTKTKTESYVFGDFGNGISRGWERKLTNRRFATGRFWPFTWKISFVGKGKVNKREFCKLKITLNVVFVIMIQSIFFISSIGANALHDFCSGIADPFIFIH